MLSDIEIKSRIYHGRYVFIYFVCYKL